MKYRVFFVILLVSYLGLMPPMTEALLNRPVSVKAGRMPSGEVLKVTLGEYRTLVADWMIVRTLFYFGTIFELNDHNVTSRPEYGQMYNNLTQALKLDPYNLDAYYFSQAIFTWDVGKIVEVNRLLDYGMKYRTWDWQLPFWAGFNSAYFLKEYNSAAIYFKKAAELSKNSLFTNLAARYFHESGQDELGILFLDTMMQSAKDKNVRDLYEIRKNALIAISQIKKAAYEYEKKFGNTPKILDNLVESGFLTKIPEDPYGGVFYFDEQGGIQTTSKLTFMGENAMPASAPNAMPTKKGQR